MKQLSQSKLAEMIKTSRRELGLSQEQLCEKTGINRTMIGRIERMDYIPTVPQLEKLSSVLKIEVDSFFEESNPTIRTAFRGKNLSAQEKAGTDMLLDMMMTAKQQIVLRKALHNE